MHLQPHICNAPAGSAAFVEQGAQLVGWVPRSQEPVLWVAEQAKWIEGKTVRGGVPICFPWFGVGRTPKPYKHGGARLAQWRQIRNAIEGEDTVLEFQLCGPSEVLQQPFVATYTVWAGQQLRMELAIKNTGTESLDVEAALHTYLAVADIERTQVIGLEGTEYLDAVPGQEGLKHQRGPLRFSEQTDRIYISDGQVQVVDEVASRTITVAKGGSGATVVWNPWADGAAGMADFGDDEWRTMLCVEAAAARDCAMLIPAGETKTLWQELSVQSN